MFKIIFTISLAFFFSVQSSADATEDCVRKNAIQFDPNDLSAILSPISKFEVVTIGEMHGSQEAPQFTHDLFQSLRKPKRKIVLGIEVPEEDQPLVDSFVQTKDRSILKKSKFFTRNFQDGRSSESMVKLLEDLPKDAIVICFDSPNTGSGHWACMGNTEVDCKIHQMNPPSSPYGAGVDDTEYFLPEPLSGGYNATLFYRALTPSPPAFRHNGMPFFRKSAQLAVTPTI